MVVRRKRRQVSRKMKHTPLNCNTCDLGKELKDDDRFKQLKIKSHKCSELLIKFEETK